MRATDKRPTTALSVAGYGGKEERARIWRERGEFQFKDHAKVLEAYLAPIAAPMRLSRVAQPGLVKDARAVVGTA